MSLVKEERMHKGQKAWEFLLRGSYASPYNLWDWMRSPLISLTYSESDITDGTHWKKKLKASIRYCLNGKDVAICFLTLSMCHKWRAPNSNICSPTPENCYLKSKDTAKPPHNFCRLLDCFCLASGHIHGPLVPTAATPLQSLPLSQKPPPPAAWPLHTEFPLPVQTLVWSD